MPKVLLITVLFIFLWSCVKRPSTSPNPTISYNNFQAWKVRGTIDTAVAVLNYEDGDGDIFLDNTTQGPNIIGTFYYLNKQTGQFSGVKDNITNNTLRFTQTVLMPNDVNYNGKSIKGEMYIPIASFRTGDTVKTFKYTFFVQDKAGHKSNVITTPSITINF